MLIRMGINLALDPAIALPPISQRAGEAPRHKDCGVVRNPVREACAVKDRTSSPDHDGGFCASTGAKGKEGAGGPGCRMPAVQCDHGAPGFQKFRRGQGVRAPSPRPELRKDWGAQMGRMSSRSAKGYLVGVCWRVGDSRPFGKGRRGRRPRTRGSAPPGLLIILLILCS
jgi:hypothetical protein